MEVMLSIVDLLIKQTCNEFIHSQFKKKNECSMIKSLKISAKIYSQLTFFKPEKRIHLVIVQSNFQYIWV